jgi:hypothetical protein
MILWHEWGLRPHSCRGSNSIFGRSEMRRLMESPSSPFGWPPLDGPSIHGWNSWRQGPVYEEQALIHVQSMASSSLPDRDLARGRCVGRSLTAGQIDSPRYPCSPETWASIHFQSTTFGPRQHRRLAQGCSLVATFTRWEDRSPRRFCAPETWTTIHIQIEHVRPSAASPLGTGMLPRGHLHPMGRSPATPPLRSRRNPCSVAKAAGAALSGIAAGRGTLTRAILNPYEGPDRRESSLRGTQASLGGQASVSCAEGRRVRRFCLGRSSIYVKIERRDIAGRGT